MTIELLVHRKQFHQPQRSQHMANFRVGHNGSDYETLVRTLRFCLDLGPSKICAEVPIPSIEPRHTWVIRSSSSRATPFHASRASLSSLLDKKPYCVDDLLNELWIECRGCFVEEHVAWFNRKCAGNCKVRVSGNPAFGQMLSLALKSLSG